MKTVKIVDDKITLLIYSNNQTMRKSLKKRGMRNIRNVQGCLPNNRYWCQMVLSKETSIDTVMHECLHAAAWLMRRNKMTPNLSRKYSKPEEVLAYYQNWVFQEVLTNFKPKRVIFELFDHEDVLRRAGISFKRAHV